MYGLSEAIPQGRAFLLAEVEHFCEFYDVLHTQGGQWLVEEIDKMINERRK